MTHAQRSADWAGCHPAGGAATADGLPPDAVHRREVQPLRLLLVEPYALLARALKRGFEEEGFAVDAVGDRGAAEARVEEDGYDLILIDLPVDTTLDAVRRWRFGGLRSPVLVCVNPGRDSDRRAEIRGESCDTFSKPFVLDDLLTHVRTLVRSNGRFQSSPGVIGVSSLASIDRNTPKLASRDRGPIP